MSEKNKVEIETRLWLTYAQRDLAAAQALLRNKVIFAHQVCFLSQQAAEKGLKAALIFLQIEFPFRHDLEFLRTLFPQDWECSRLSNLPRLTEWGIESRYPSFLIEPSEQDAKIAFQQATFILEAVARDLSRQGFLM
jgi:HEPN domain-containing protein